jgi:hypothetical protein
MRDSYEGVKEAAIIRWRYIFTLLSWRIINYSMGGKSDAG